MPLRDLAKVSGGVSTEKFVCGRTLLELDVGRRQVPAARPRGVAVEADSHA